MPPIKKMTSMSTRRIRVENGDRYSAGRVESGRVFLFGPPEPVLDGRRIRGIKRGVSASSLPSERGFVVDAGSDPPALTPPAQGVAFRIDSSPNPESYDSKVGGPVEEKHSQSVDIVKTRRGSGSKFMKNMVMTTHRLGDEVLSTPPFTVHPESAFRRRLDMLSLCLVFYIAIVTPFQISFLSEEMTLQNIPDWPVIFTIDRFVDTVFFVDVIANFRTAWMQPETNLMVFHAGEAAKKYLHGWFWIDTASILPVELLSLISAFEVDSSSLRFPKLLKLFRLMKIAKVLRASRIMQRWEDRISLKYGWIRIMKFTAILMITAHWLACAWYLSATFADSGVGSGERPDSVEVEAVTWVSEMFPGGVSTGEVYRASLYWAVMTLTTIGYGDISAVSDMERAVCTVAMMVSVCVFSYVVGVMCSLIQSLDVSSLEFQAHMDLVNDYLTKSKIPEPLRRRVRSFMFYRRRAGLVEEQDAMKDYFSRGIQTDLAFATYGVMLRGIPQFRDAPKEFLAEVGMALHPAIYAPNEYIYMEGRDADAMYVLLRGCVIIQHTTEVNGERKNYVETKKDGTYFGANDLLVEKTRPDTACTLTFSETTILYKDDLRRILEFYPDVWHVVRYYLLRDCWARMFHLMACIMRSQGPEGLRNAVFGPGSIPSSSITGNTGMVTAAAGAPPSTSLPESKQVDTDRSGSPTSESGFGVAWSPGGGGARPGSLSPTTAGQILGRPPSSRRVTAMAPASEDAKKRGSGLLHVVPRRGSTDSSMDRSQWSSARVLRVDTQSNNSGSAVVTLVSPGREVTSPITTGAVVVPPPAVGTTFGTSGSIKRVSGDSNSGHHLEGLTRAGSSRSHHHSRVLSHSPNSTSRLLGGVGAAHHPAPAASSCHSCRTSLIGLDRSGDGCISCMVGRRIDSALKTAAERQAGELAKVNARLDEIVGMLGVLSSGVRGGGGVGAVVQHPGVTGMIAMTAEGTAEAPLTPSRRPLGGILPPLVSSSPVAAAPLQHNQD